MKLTKRKGFNFFRSYYDVYNELSDKDKVQFIDALLDRQFLGVKPKGLTGMAKFAYISQTNSIDGQVKGFEDKTGIILTPCQPPTHQVKEKGKEEVKVKGKGEDPLRALVAGWASEGLANAWLEWVQYKKESGKKLTISTAKKQLKFLGGRPDAEAIAIINKSITSGWTGLFELKDNKLGTNGKSNQRAADAVIESGKAFGSFT